MKLDKDILKAAWPPLLAFGLLTASQSFCNKPEDRNTALTEKVSAEEKRISYEQAKKKPELRQAYIEQLHNRYYRDIEELSDLVYNPEITILDLEHGKYENVATESNKLAAAFIQADEFGKRVKKPVYISRYCFDGSYSEKYGLLICTKNELIAVVGHESTHIKDQYYGVLIKDFFIDHNNYGKKGHPLYKSEVVGLILEFRAYHEEFKSIMQDKKISSRFIYGVSKSLSLAADWLSGYSSNSNISELERYLAINALGMANKKVMDFAYSKINELKDKYELSIIKR